MGGGLIELAAKGGQDMYLICNPEITFFKKVYKRHTNFALEYEKYYFDSNMDFGITSKFAIPRKGDLIKNMFLQIELPELISTDNKLCSYVNYIGYSILEYIEIYIGTTLIERLTGESLYILNELTVKADKKRGYREMVGGKDFLDFNIFNGNKGGLYIIPLNFFFSKDIGSALPYVALQYHEIEVKIKLKDFDKLWITNDGLEPLGEFKLKDCRLCVEYVYLDNDERKLFAKSSHEYLIKQTQYSLNNIIKENTTKQKIQLDFYHPIVELIFVVQTKSKFLKVARGGNDYFNYSKTDNFPLKDTIKTAKIVLNGVDRTVEMTNKELRLYYPIERHTSVPDNFIYLYSFSLNPESFQPSGSCNFSRFDNKELEIEFEDNIPNSELKIFAINYNILRISKGLGGLAYVN